MLADPRSQTFASDAQRQAQNLQVVYSTVHATSYVSRGYWFSVQDVPEGNVFYGLVEGGYVAGDQSAANLALRKPAFAAYQKYAN